MKDIVTLFINIHLRFFFSQSFYCIILILFDSIFLLLYDTSDLFFYIWLIFFIFIFISRANSSNFLNINNRLLEAKGECAIRFMNSCGIFIFFMYEY